MSGIPHGDADPRPSSTDSTAPSTTTGSTEASTASPSSPPASSPSVIIFDSQTLFGSDRPGGDDGHVFQLGGDKPFKWAIANSSVTPTYITWLITESSSMDPSTSLGVNTIANGSFSEISSGEPFFDQLTNTSVFLHLDDGRTLGEFKDMKIRINWQLDGTQGYTESGLFTVAADPTSHSSESETLDFNTRAKNDPSEEFITPKSSGPRPQPSGAVGGLTGGGGSSSSSGSNQGGVSGNEGGSNSGLSSGAIAGIAVACVVVGLAVIGALIWFLLLRKRRSTKTHRYNDTGYDRQPAAGASFMTDKEEARARVAESADTSPYSDDSHRHGHIPPAAAAAGVAAGVRGPPVDDEQAVLEGAETPQGGVSRNIAHLVEEGMTEDEIRRLEEEERHLDDEIERAARVPTA